MKLNTTHRILFDYFVDEPFVSNVLASSTREPKLLILKTNCLTLESIYVVEYGPDKKQIKSNTLQFAIEAYNAVESEKELQSKREAVSKYLYPNSEIIDAAIDSAIAEATPVQINRALAAMELKASNGIILDILIPKK